MCVFERKETNTNEIQDLQLKLIRLSSHNALDGEMVADDLENNRDLWRAAYLTREYCPLIQLRDLPAGHWNADTIFLLPAPGQEKGLRKMAEKWRGDTVAWLGGEEAGELLGTNEDKIVENKQCILRIWWD